MRYAVCRPVVRDCQQFMQPHVPSREGKGAKVLTKQACQRFADPTTSDVYLRMHSCACRMAVAGVGGFHAGPLTPTGSKALPGNPLIVQVYQGADDPGMTQDSRTAFVVLTPLIHPHSPMQLRSVIDGPLSHSHTRGSVPEVLAG